MIQCFTIKIKHLTTLYNICPNELPEYQVIGLLSGQSNSHQGQRNEAEKVNSFEKKSVFLRILFRIELFWFIP